MPVLKQSSGAPRSNVEEVREDRTRRQAILLPQLVIQSVFPMERVRALSICPAWHMDCKITSCAIGRFALSLRGCVSSYQSHRQ
ncbi:hypothetical protein PISMIDRAFT_290001 [Pisolithus microcarpus 441]|uniref:Uncharacterized protein n=1 Tax=Pisolithus microcarpus 441 TaxID=765257 RepID=A0A0C9Z0B6_9AGAM|nr:hypothetical protein PISMIDRAFT_290001 [Pisolithus microcarpus 441]